MIREMKREALQSLKGKWGLGAGGTFLFFILYYVASFIVMIPSIVVLPLGIGALGGFEEGEISTGGIVIFCIVFAFMIIVSLAAYGVIMYGYANMCLQLSRRKATINDLFEGFRGFKTMMKTMKSMVLIFLYTGNWLPILLTAIPAFLVEENNRSVADSLRIPLFVLLLISFIIITIRYLSYMMTYFIMIDRPECGALQAMKESKVMMKGHKMSLFLLWLSFIGWGILVIFTFGIGIIWLYPYMGTTIAAFYNEISEN